MNRASSLSKKQLYNSIIVRSARPIFLRKRDHLSGFAELLYVALLYIHQPNTSGDSYYSATSGSRYASSFFVVLLKVEEHNNGTIINY